MPNTASTITSVLLPYFTCRRPIRPATSSHRRSRWSTINATPPANQGRKPPGSVLPQRSHARAPTMTTNPRGASRSTSFLRAFMEVSGPPPLALLRAVGEEEAEADEGQVEDDVLERDDALGQVVHVRRDAEVGERLLEGPAHRIVEPAQRPEAEVSAEGQDAGDDLVRGKRRYERVDAEEAAAEQEE